MTWRAHKLRILPLIDVHRNVSARSTALELTPAIIATEHTLVVGAQTLHYNKSLRAIYCTVVQGLSGAPLYLTRRVYDGTYENKPTNRKEQLKKSPQPTKETSAWHRPRKNNNRIKYQKSWCVTARLFLVPSFARMVPGRDQFPPRTTHPSI